MEGGSRKEEREEARKGGMKDERNAQPVQRIARTSIHKPRNDTSHSLSAIRSSSARFEGWRTR